MQRFATSLHALEVAAAVLLGVFFFFLIIGVFGLGAAIVGLLVFIFGAILTAMTAPGGGALHET
jgi:hypothetical protein